MTFIPLPYYTEIYINILLLTFLYVVYHTSTNTGFEFKVRLLNRSAVMLLLVFVIFYMGLRPISGYYFGDMATYARKYEYLLSGGELTGRDYGFNIFIKTCTHLMSVEWFFLLCSALYIIPIYIAVKRWHNDYAFLALIACIGSFSFWSYGTNGIRAGLASSFFICAISYRKVLPVMIPLLLISVSFHKSMMLPFVAFVLTFIHNKPKSYLIAWFAAIGLSLLMGGFWENLFASLGFGDERMTAYMTSNEFAHQFSSTGFRWDFLLYSSVAVIVGYLYIVKYNFKDKFYFQLYGTYVICNAFWILVIRAAFSNRFAYLSWFLMALVIVYPLLKHRMFHNQYSKIGYVLFVYFSFSYVMYHILT
ncbi:MAG: EpsG family protein [Carboxylicivirga sp.]|nr:EpsG family protein [Carboxylicivirga sp.]